MTFTEDLNDFASRLGASDVLFFALTTGELAFTDAQKAAIVRVVEDGGGLMGAHSATDTLYDWPDYGRMIGAYFKEHPWTQEATITVEDGSHPATRDLGASFRFQGRVLHVPRQPAAAREACCSSLNAASVGAQGDFPLAWSQSIGQGRTFYTALGHFASTWTDARFQAHSARRDQVGGEAGVETLPLRGHTEPRHVFRTSQQVSRFTTGFRGSQRLSRLALEPRFRGSQPEPRYFTFLGSCRE